MDKLFGINAPEIWLNNTKSLHSSPQIPGQEVPAPEQYAIQTLVGIRQADGWRFTSFQNTLIQSI